MKKLCAQSVFHFAGSVWKDAIERVFPRRSVSRNFHTDDAPALFLGHVIHPLAQGPDLGVGQVLRGPVGVFALRVIVHEDR